MKRSSMVAAALAGFAVGFSIATLMIDPQSLGAWGVKRILGELMLGGGMVALVVLLRQSQQEDTPAASPGGGGPERGRDLRCWPFRPDSERYNYIKRCREERQQWRREALQKVTHYGNLVIHYGNFDGR